MLQTLLAYGNGAEIANRWLVLDGDAEFFRITKRLHNLLHGSPGDGGLLGQAEHDHYRAVLALNLEQLERHVSPGDIVLIHDPQTAGLAEGLRRRGHGSSGVVTWGPT
jgi:trehalose synthase